MDVVTVISAISVCSWKSQLKVKLHYDFRWVYTLLRYFLLSTLLLYVLCAHTHAVLPMLSHYLNDLIEQRDVRMK